MLHGHGLVGRTAYCPMDWYADSGPPTINDDFSAGALNGWTFTRTSTATDSTYMDGSDKSTYNIINANTPRFNAFGMLIEPARTNLFINSDVPVTQSVTLATGGYYAIWYVGTGTVVVGGVSGSVTGLGTVPVNGFLLINASAGAVVSITLSGTIYRVQCELGTAPTSYVVSGASPATRTAEHFNKNYFGGQLNLSEGTYWLEFMTPGFSDGQLLNAGTGSYTSSLNSDHLITLNSGAVPPVGSITAQVSDATGGPGMAVTMGGSAMTNHRIAMAVSMNRMAVAFDYTLVGTRDPNRRPPALLNVILGGGGTNGGECNVIIRGFRYWPTAMQDAELKECTSPGYYGGPPVMLLDFTKGVVPREISWSRTGNTGVVTDSVVSDAPGSSYNTFGATVPRLSSAGLLFEPSRANYIWPNPNPPASRTTVSLGIQRFCLWMIGTGSCTVAGTTATITDVNGKGYTATQGNMIWFDVTVSGTVTVTTTGTVNRSQLEQCGTATVGLSGPTSFVGTDTTWRNRGSDTLTMPTAGWYPMARDGTMFIEYQAYPARLVSGAQILCAFNAGGGEREQMFNQSPDVNTTNMQTWAQTVPSDGSGWQTVQAPVFNIGYGDLTVHRAAFAFGGGGAGVGNNNIRKLAFDGVLTTNGASNTNRGQTIATFGIFTQFTGSPINAGRVRRVRVYDYILSDADMQALTLGGPAATLVYDFLTALPANFTFARASTAMMFDSTGTLVSVGNNVPRFEYDPNTRVPLGLLFEETRTNMALNSGDLSLLNTNASPNDCTRTPNAAVAPDGTTTAAKLTPTVTSGAHTCFGTLSFTNGTTYVFSVFLKAAGYTTANIALSGPAFAAGGGANYDLVAGTVSGISVGTAGIQNCGNGWYRCWYSQAANASGNGYYGINPRQAAAFAGDGTSGIYSWGAQVEASPVALGYLSSYIPTGAATATRINDSCTAPTTPDFNQTQGSLVAAFIFPRSACGVAVTPVLAQLDASNNNDLIGLRLSGNAIVSLNPVTFVGGAISGNIGPANQVVPNSMSKGGLTYGGGGNITGCLNGGAVASGAASLPAVPFNRISVGAGRSSWLCGYLRRVRYWNRALTDAELQDATA